MSDFKADLHCHTTFSDGTYSPERILDLAKKIGLKGLSITDHDTVDAYETAIPLAKEKGIDLIVGVEFSTMLKENSIHVLGYSFDINNVGINELCKRHHERRKVRNLAMLNKLAENNIIVTEEEMNVFSPIGTVGRPHIAQVLMQKGYVLSVQEAFEKYLGEGKSCYMRSEHISVEETLDVIHQANGFAIIAHPQLVHSQRALRTLLTMPFDGIECYYGKFPHDESKKWLKIAQEKKWLVTGGSDFHGDIKPQINLGSSWIGEEHFLKLKHVEL